jgi:ribosome maturation factor RimP
MAVKKGSNVISVVAKLAEPVATEQNLTIWDIEFIKEGAAWYLRFFIDKPEGITLDDCELFHRRIDPILDEADPISHSYYLEVSSPGIERELNKPWHFELMIGKQILIRLIRPDTIGRKELIGTLKEYTDGAITLQIENEEIKIKQSDTAFVKLFGELNKLSNLVEIDNIGGNE